MHNRGRINDEKEVAIQYTAILPTTLHICTMDLNIVVAVTLLMEDTGCSVVIEASHAGQAIVEGAHQEVIKDGAY